MNARILVVEDNALNCELLCDWLEAEGYQVVAVADLRAAVAAIENQPPAVVLLDVQLGGESGLSLAAWMRQQPSLLDLPIIAVTAHALQAEKERILRAGCSACISKPVEFPVLRQSLERWLANSSKADPEG